MNIWVWNLTWHSTSPFRTQESRLFSNQLWQNMIFFWVKTGESLPLGDGSSLTASATVSSSSSTLTPQHWWNNSHFQYIAYKYIAYMHSLPAHHPRYGLSHNIDPFKVVLSQLNLVLREETFKIWPWYVEKTFFLDYKCCLARVKKCRSKMMGPSFPIWMRLSTSSSSSWGSSTWLKQINSLL